MKTAVNIRPAKNHDAKKIYQFLCALEEQIFDLGVFDLHYRSCLAGINNIYLVAAQADNEPIGYLSCHGQLLLHHGGIVYEIQELYVEPAWRKKGIGRMLLKALDEYLTRREWKSLEVTTNRKRPETIAFYTRNGFQLTHVKCTRPVK